MESFFKKRFSLFVSGVVIVVGLLVAGVILLHRNSDEQDAMLPESKGLSGLSEKDIAPSPEPSLREKSADRGPGVIASKLSFSEFDAEVRRLERSFREMERDHIRSTTKIYHDDRSVATFAIPPIAEADIEKWLNDLAAMKQNLETKARPHGDGRTKYLEKKIAGSGLHRIVHVSTDADGFASFNVFSVPTLEGISVNETGWPEVPPPLGHEANPDWSSSGSYSKEFEYLYGEAIPPHLAATLAKTSLDGSRAVKTP